MNETEEIIKNQYKKLSEPLRRFVISGNWRKSVFEICNKFGLDEDQATSIENEVLFVLIGLEPVEDFINNIYREAVLDSSGAEKIGEEIEKLILEPFSDEIDSLIEKGEINKTSFQETSGKTGGVGEDFEQIILSQAKAMQPAVAPDNLPTGEHSESHGYTGNDPYHEPLE